MYQIIVTLRNGRAFLYTTDSQDIADCRMSEFNRDPQVLQARWYRSTAS